MPILETPQLQPCGKCGTVLSFYAPQGLCAACLLESAFAEQTGRDEPTKTAPLLAFDDYELLEEIARGGMGVVYRARQVSLNRMVAVKMILAGQLANAAEVQRFKAEAETVAQLRHPNIVAIYEVGMHNGQSFFSMDYVEGWSLAELTHGGPLPARLAARYLKTIAEAMQYAHSRGVLHRDLKPSNILIDAVGQPRITDFGLAKRFDAVAADVRRLTASPSPGGDGRGEGGRDSGSKVEMDQSLLTAAATGELTLTGQVLGSPNFMPPEQASYDRRSLGPASDVYSLGAVLYQLLTGRPPFLADSVPATLRLVSETEPVAPRLLVPTIPRDLETICLKCLEKDPGRRYGTAQELADELGRFLREESIHARPTSRTERLLRWRRRHPAIAGLTLLVGLLMIAVAVVSTVSAIRLKQANEAGREKLRDSYLAQARANRWSGLAGRRFDSLEALRNAAEIRPSIELRNQAIACMALVDLRPVKEWETRDLAPFVFDATYERYATTNNRGDVVVRRVNDDRELMNVPETRLPVHELGFSPDGQFLAARFKPGDFRTRVFDLPSKMMVAEFTNGAFCFTPDSRSLAVGQHRLNTRPSVIIHDLRTRREVASLKIDFAPEVMKFNPTGDRLALVERWGSKVQIRDARTGTLVRSLDHAKAVSSFDWHPSGDYLAASSYDRLVHVWDFTQRERRDMNLAHGDVSILAFYSHQGGLLTSVGWNNVLRFWNATSGRELLSVPALGYRGAPFSADDRWIAYWMGRQKIRLCELAPGRECRAVSFGDSLHGAVFCDVSPDGQLPALVLRLHLRLWDETATRDLARVPEDGVVGARYDVAGNNLITAGTHGLKRWPMEWRRGTAGRSLRIGPPEEFGPRGAIQAFWLVDNRKRLLALKTPTLHVLDAGTRRELSQVRLDAETGSSLASPDGKWFAAELPNSGTVRVWEIESGRAVVDLPVATAVGLAFTPDGHLLLVGSEVEYAAWRCDSWKRAYAIPRPDTGGARSRVTFNSDGSVGAVTDGPESIRLFDPATGREFATLEPPEPSAITALKFSLDGAHLMATTDRSGIHIWDLRLIRQQLAAMKLDWDSPPLPLRHTNASGAPLHITFLKVPVPPRDPRCTSAQIDLSAHYNCTFTNFAVMTGLAGNDLAPLATGLQTLADTDFDVRGAVQLLGHKKYAGSPAPAQVTGIVVDQSCRAVSFLHSCLYADANGVPRGAIIGEYIVHYTDGRSETIPLINGENIADWWDFPPQPRKMGPGTAIAWRGSNAASQRVANDIVLHKFRWENPHSDTPIATLEFKSALIDTAPFLIAITLD